MVGIFIFQNLHLPNENNSRGFWLFTAFVVCAKCELLRRKYGVSHALPAGCFPLYCANAKETVSIPIYNINCIFLYYSKFPNGKSSGQYIRAPCCICLTSRCTNIVNQYEYQQSEYDRCLR